MHERALEVAKVSSRQNAELMLRMVACPACDFVDRPVRSTFLENRLFALIFSLPIGAVCGCGLSGVFARFAHLGDSAVVLIVGLCWFVTFIAASGSVDRQFREVGSRVRFSTTDSPVHLS